VNMSNTKKLPFMSFVNAEDYQYLLSCAVEKYNHLG